jgi:hypothetical protein
MVSPEMARFSAVDGFTSCYSIGIGQKLRFLEEVTSLKRHLLCWPTNGRTGAAWLGLALLLCTGCGLEDYEKQMAAEQKWVEKFDRIVGAENQLLGDPLDMPPKIPGPDKKDEKGKTVTTKVNPLPDFFLRPPAGISSKAGNPLGTISATLYPYSGERVSLRLSLAGTSDKKKRTADFQGEVCLNAGITYQKKTVKKETLGPEAREFDWTSQDIGAKHYAVYFLAQNNDQLAVIFEMPKDRAKEMDKVIEVCLGTLELGYHSYEISSAYDQTNNRGKYFRLRMEGK